MHNPDQLFQDYEILLAACVAGSLDYFLLGAAFSAWGLQSGFCLGILLYTMALPGESDALPQLIPDSQIDRAA